MPFEYTRCIIYLSISAGLSASKRELVYVPINDQPAVFLVMPLNLFSGESLLSRVSGLFGVSNLLLSRRLNPTPISGAWFTRVAEKDFEYAIISLLDYFWPDSILGVVHTLHSVSVNRMFIRKDQFAAFTP